MTDLAVRWRRDGFDAIAHDRRARGGSTTYVSSLLGHRAVVLGDHWGARLFYDEDVVERADAAPAPLARLLVGRGAVHGLDGVAHRARKGIFAGLLGADQVNRCASLARSRLREAASTWDGAPSVDLHDELVCVYGGAVLRWAGVDLPEWRLRQLSRRYARVVAGSGFGSTSASARVWTARRHTDRWARGLLDDVRHGRWVAPAGSVVATLAASDLDLRTAAVELGNVVRPTVAVSWFGAHLAAALGAMSPAGRAALADPGAIELQWSCAQETRRIAPIVPALVGRVRRPTAHEGIALAAGDRVVLDVRAVDLDPERYPDPSTFRADRFLTEQPGLYDLVPQGGGPAAGHRCPGESMTLLLLVHTVEVLAGVPLSLPGTEVDLTRIPALPSGAHAARVGAGEAGVVAERRP